jgi:CBS domain-containing protein
VTIAPDASLAAAWTAMRDRRIRHLPVIDPTGRLLGIVTHRDLLSAAQSSLTFRAEDDRLRLLARSTVEEIMETHLGTTTVQAPAAEAGMRMVRHKIGCLPVLDPGGRLAGIVTEEDFLRWAASRMTAVVA